jgi:hypothetical protein
VSSCPTHPEVVVLGLLPGGVRRAMLQEIINLAEVLIGLLQSGEFTEVFRQAILE